MKVRGLIKEYVDVKISIEDALKVISNEMLGFDIDLRGRSSYCLVQADSKNNKTGKDGIYSVYEDSDYHGGCATYSYSLKTDNQDTVELFKDIKKIGEYYHKYIRRCKFCEDYYSLLNVELTEDPKYEKYKVIKCPRCCGVNYIKKDEIVM